MRVNTNAEQGDSTIYIQPRLHYSHKSKCKQGQNKDGVTVIKRLQFTVVQWLRDQGTSCGGTVEGRMEYNQFVIRKEYGRGGGNGSAYRSASISQMMRWDMSRVEGGFAFDVTDVVESDACSAASSSSPKEE